MSKFIKKSLSIAILTLISFTFLHSSINHQQVKAESKEFIQKTKPKKAKYKICSDSSFAPFEFQDSNGKYIGIDVELMHRVAKLCGFEIDMEFVGFEPALNQLRSGQSDGMIAGMSITDERKSFANFSKSYCESGLRIAVNKENSTIKDFSDLKNKKIGAKLGTAAKKFLEENKNKYGYIIETSDESSTMYENLLGGLIDAFVDDEPVIKYAIKQGKNFKLVGNKEEAASYGFAVLKGENQELVEMFNEAFSYLEETGEFKQILDKYTNFDLPKEEKSKFLNLTLMDWQALGEGLLNNVFLISIAFPIAILIAIIFGLFSVSDSKFLKMISSFYVDVARGVPLIILSFFVMYGVPKLFGMGAIDKYLAGVIALVLNASAYISEIIRGGILAISKGQTEASRSLGLSYKKTMQKIILPQAFKIMIPSFINQFVISLKDTTILQALAITEAMLVSRNIVQRNFSPFEVYGVTALVFLLTITLLTKFAKMIEKKVRIK